MCKLFQDEAGIDCELPTVHRRLDYGAQWGILGYCNLNKNHQLQTPGYQTKEYLTQCPTWGANGALTYT